VIDISTGIIKTGDVVARFFDISPYAYLRNRNFSPNTRDSTQARSNHEEFAPYGFFYEIFIKIITNPMRYGA